MYEFNASSMFQKMGQGQQKTGKAMEHSKNTCFFPQVNRLTDNRLWHHDWIFKGHPQKTPLSQARVH